jgi:hypothetical protein
MERFVVTHTPDGLWSVSHQEHILSIYPTEEQALSATFKLASQFSQPGHRAVVSIARASTASETRQSTRIHRGYS